MSIDLYTILFIISILFFGVLISAFRNRISSFYVLLFSSILICCFGYMQLASADSMKMALFANQTAYLGGSVSPFFLLMCLADLCKVNIRRRYQVILLSMGLMIFGLVSTVGVVDWYYVTLLASPSLSRGLFRLFGEFRKKGYDFWSVFGKNFRVPKNVAVPLHRDFAEATRTG